MRARRRAVGAQRCEAPRCFRGSSALARQCDNCTCHVCTLKTQKSLRHPPAHSTVSGSTLLLLDSGGQYDCGTTDITRTMHLGAPDEYQRRCYTRVLQGHIGLDRVRARVYGGGGRAWRALGSCAARVARRLLVVALRPPKDRPQSTLSTHAHQVVFPEGTPGSAVDALARLPLWAEGLNYRHGTGHGVGAALNVHEGPQSISTRYWITTPLQARAHAPSLPLSAPRKRGALLHILLCCVPRTTAP